MSLSWHQKPLITVWILVVRAQPEGLGATPALALADARQRRREEYLQGPKPGCSLSAWLAPLQTAELIQLSGPSLQQIGQAILGWVDPGVGERASWIASLQRFKVILLKSSRYRLRF